jgi:TDG/mug DNA glycosylase family protein
VRLHNGRMLPDVLAPGLSVVFCGTAVGTASARIGAYYAGPGNAFWRSLFEVGLTPRRLQPPEYPGLADFGLGLTDLAKNISGADHELSRWHFDGDGLRAKLQQHQPHILAFTSKRAAEEFLGHPVPYGLLEERVGATALFVLPSPSGAARRYWDLQPWHELAALRNSCPIAELRPPSIPGENAPSSLRQ